MNDTKIVQTCKKNKCIPFTGIQERTKPLPFTAAQGWETLLQKEDWDYFITPTTGYELTLPSARRGMERLFDKICNVSLPGQKKFFWAAEPFDCKEGYHTHGLLKTDAPIGVIAKAWQVASGGKKRNKWNRIDIKRYNKKLGATKYCAKYIQKYMADYDLLCSR